MVTGLNYKTKIGKTENQARSFKMAMKNVFRFKSSVEGESTDTPLSPIRVQLRRHTL